MSSTIVTVQDQTADFHDAVRAGRRVLSYSQIAEWLHCQHRWWLKYGLGISSGRATDPMELGTAVHQAFAAVLAGDGTPETAIRDWMNKTLPSLPADFSSDADLERIQRLGDTAIAVTHKGLEAIAATGWETYYLASGAPGVELELVHPIKGFEYFAGHIDWLAFDPDSGRIWLVDFKVRKQFSGPGYEDVNLQHMVYCYLCRAAGIDVTGTVTLEIRAEPPMQPKILDRGGMSRARVSTDWPTYRAALLREGMNPDDYAEMEAKLDVPFSQVLTAYRPTEQIETIWAEIVEPAAAAIDYNAVQANRGHRNIGIIRNLNHRSCSGCGVRDICLGALRDYDIPGLLQNYKYREEPVRLALERGSF